MLAKTLNPRCCDTNETKSRLERSKLRQVGFQSGISAHVRMFFLWEDLGHGADGETFLVLAVQGVGVLKFSTRRS
jgi:hypothetical protein